MPNIITATYFTDKAELTIPNAISGNVGEGLNKKLQSIIDKYERMILLELLGGDQYNILQGELDKLPFNSQAVEAADTAHQRFVNGYEDWQGLKPLLGNYIYCFWMRSDEIKVGTVGSGKGKKQGFTIADRSSEYAERWNDFIIELEDTLEYLEASPDFEVSEDFPYDKYVMTNTLGF